MKHETRICLDISTLPSVDISSSDSQSYLEEVGQPQPANFANGEYDDANNDVQPANVYYPPNNPQQHFRGDQGNYEDSTNDPNSPPYIPQRRLLHLDLKGAPPKIDYLIKILKMTSDLGVTGVLLEYEDMFHMQT